MRSCSSMVLQRFLPLVSGKMITMKLHKNIVSPKVPKDRNLFLVPAEVNIGTNAEPRTIACLINVEAEFLTVVGNNSIVNIITTFNAKEVQKKDASSNPICMPSVPLPTTPQIMLHMPLIIHKANNDPFLFHLAIKKRVTKFVGINIEAFNMTPK